MNWGYRILIAYIAGVSFILYFVVGSMRANTEMVEDNYYEKELGFNHQIEATANAKNTLPAVKIEINGNTVDVMIDSMISANASNGLIHFYNPASEKADRKFEFGSSTTGDYSFPKHSFAKGNYIVKISFEENGKPYYTEKTIFIP